MATLPALQEIDWVEFLVRRKFPPPLPAMGLKYGGNGPFGLQPALNAQATPSEAAAYRKTLLKLPKNKLDALVKQEQIALKSEQEALHRKLKEEEENARPFNTGEALEPDYAYWAKMGTWEWDEATALSLGRNPLVVKPRLLDDYRYQSSPFVKEYAKRRELIRRSALWAGTMVTSPADFYKWAQTYQIELPTDLVKQLEIFANPLDWKKAYVALDKKRTELEARIQQLEAVPQAKPEKKGPLTRERNTLVRLVYGMAREGYRWADDGKKASPASRIVRDMEQFGRISEDTVIKYLKEGKELSEEN